MLLDGRLLEIIIFSIIVGQVSVLLWWSLLLGGIIELECLIGIIIVLLYWDMCVVHEFFYVRWNLMIDWFITKLWHLPYYMVTWYGDMIETRWKHLYCSIKEVQVSLCCHGNKMAWGIGYFKYQHDVRCYDKLGINIRLVWPVAGITY